MITKLLVKCFIKNSEEIENPIVRSAYGMLGGILGIVCNIFLFIIKLIIGSAMHSVAILSDAFNNLSDIGSSAVTFIGAKLSAKKPDKEHPFGHGRIEYICSLIVSFMIISVGLELVRTSFDKILHPTAPVMNLWMMLILALSASVKLWMFFSLRTLGNKIHSEVLLAAASDSFGDTVATSVVVLCVAASKFLPPVTDGIVGLIVAVLICITGIKVALSTINTLLGQSPDPATAKQIAQILTQNKEIIGYHDLMIHDYGPGRILASVHAEVDSAKSSIMLHEVIDGLETEIFEKIGVETVIHTDPILVGCEKSDNTKLQLQHLIRKIDPSLGMHDFRMTDGEKRINLIFDLEVPFSYDDEKKKETLLAITKSVTETNTSWRPIIHIDYKQEFESEED